MKERPIPFNGEMTRAIIEGRKTMTRRVACPPGFELTEYGAAHCKYGQPGDRLWVKNSYYLIYKNNIPIGTEIVYGLTDERIYATIICNEVMNERHNACEWDPSKGDPSISERGLCGRVGRTDLLTDKIQRIWAQGIRGLVSVKRIDNKERLPEYLTLPPESQSNKIGTSLGLYGFSWDAPFFVSSGSPLGRESQKQSTGESCLGNTRRELAGQKRSRAWDEWRKTPDGKTYGLGTLSGEMGDREGADKPETCGEDPGNVSGWDICYCTSRIIKRPSIFMPRCASRILLEVTAVRVERLQDISEDDAKAEGMSDDYIRANFPPSECFRKPTAREAFRALWDYINVKRGYGWDVNPWVWVIEFKRINENEGAV